MNGKIYLIHDMINDKIYIGQTTQTVNQRFSQHKCRAKKLGKWAAHIHYIMNEVGIENFEIMTIEEKLDTQEKLDQSEKYWIEIYGATNPEIGYNIDFGGIKGNRFSEQHKLKISKAISGENNKNYIKLKQMMLNN